MYSRCSDQSMLPSMNRSMSVPDTGSMWDMHTSASQSSGTFYTATGYTDTHMCGLIMWLNKSSVVSL